VHTINTGVDNVGDLYIDGSYIGPLGSYGYTTTYEVDLAVGTHSVSVLNVLNSGSRGGIAIQILYESSEIWTTLTPRRSNPPYLYWAEVSRIPLASFGSTPATYYSGEHIIKENFLAVGSTRYNDYFGDPGKGLFTINDDGFYNITVTVNSLNAQWPTGNSSVDATLLALQYCLKFYEEAVPRLSQLYIPLPNYETVIFNGFTLSGNILTYIGNYSSTPQSPGTSPPPQDGGNFDFQAF
jgi:hypothetical protein